MITVVMQAQQVGLSGWLFGWLTSPSCFLHCTWHEDVFPQH